MSRWSIFSWVVLAATVGATSVSGQMQYPLAVTAMDDGTIFVGDRHVPGIWKIDGSQLALFFEGSTKFRTPLNAVRCLAIDASGVLLAGDSATREVYRLSDDAKATPLTDGGIGIPMSIAVNSQGELLVADLELHRIWKVPAAGGAAEVFAEVPAPRGVSVDQDDNLWVVSHGENQLLRVSPDGKKEAIVQGDRPFQFPHNVVLSSSGTAFVSDGYAKAIWKVPAGGKPAKFASGDPLVNPVGLTLRGKNLLVADPHAKAVFEITPDGKISPLEIQLKQ